MNCIKLLRPHQWTKNVFVFLPLFFGGQLTNTQLLLQCVVAFFAFCFAASSIYCFNDIWDVEADRAHAVKRLRPIASGKVSVGVGYAMMAIAAALSVGLSLSLYSKVGIWPLCIIGIYYVLNLAYCIWLKHLALLDVTIISLGFVIRIVLGGQVTGIVLTHWIIIMTFLLALFLAIAKRRDDVLRRDTEGVATRRSVQHYSLAFMDMAVSIVATMTLLAYVMYTISPEVVQRFQSPYLYATSVFVLLGILRYLQITIIKAQSGSPTRVMLTDRFLQCCIIGWVLTFVVLIYV